MTQTISSKIARITEMLAQTVLDTPAIAIAGAHAKGQADENSDIDLYLFTDSPKPYAERKKQIESFCDAGTTPWISEALDFPWGGSMDFTYEGTPVEVVVRLFSNMERQVEQSLAGKFEIIPQTWTSSGYYTYIYLSELSFIQPIFDPKNRLTAMKAACNPYPQALKKSILSTFIDRASTWIGNFHYDTAVLRGDILFTAPIVLHTILDLIQAIFALNEVYFPGDKKLLSALSNLPYCPSILLKNAEFLLTASTNTEALRRQQQLLTELYHEVRQKAAPYLSE